MGQINQVFDNLNQRITVLEEAVKELQRRLSSEPKPKTTKTTRKTTAKG